MSEVDAVTSEVNELTLCPVDEGRICPVRARIFDLYTEDIGEEAANFMLDDDSPRLDTMKMAAILTEHATRASRYGCIPVDNDACPVWSTMNGSMKSRRTAKEVIKHIIRLKDSSNGK